MPVGPLLALSCFSQNHCFAHQFFPSQNDDWPGRVGDTTREIDIICVCVLYECHVFILGKPMVGGSYGTKITMPSAVAKQAPHNALEPEGTNLHNPIHTNHKLALAGATAEIAN